MEMALFSLLIRVTSKLDLCFFHNGRQLQSHFVWFSRVMKYASGSSTGTVVFTMSSFQSPLGIVVDNGGNVYAGTYSGVFRFVPGSSNATQITPQNVWGASRIRFDTMGNLYVSGFSFSNIYKHNITANSC